MMEPVAAKAHELPWQEQETAELRAELHLMKTAGIIEVAVRNPSVAEYMAHWEARAEAAEALLKEAGKALEPFSDMAGEMFALNWEDPRVVVALDNPGDAHRVTYADFRAARAIHDKIGVKDE